MIDVSLIGFVDSRLSEKDTLHTIMTITELKSVTSIENRKKDKPMGMDTLSQVLPLRSIPRYGFKEQSVSFGCWHLVVRHMMLELMDSI